MPKSNHTRRIDLHGMYVEDAMEFLRERVARAPRVFGTNETFTIHDLVPTARNLNNPI